MLSSTVRFTQSNLQDYLDCPRRFQLRYVQSQAWPGVEADPFIEHELHLECGARFHRLIERHQLGFDAAQLERSISDSQLLEWWQAYLDFEELHALEGRRYPEFTLVGDLAGNKLAATYDLLVVTPDGRVVIFDWKTYRRVPGREYLASRVQTRLYQFLAVLSGASVVGTAVVPGDVSMIYWLVSAASAPVKFEYSELQHEQDRWFFVGLLEAIFGRDSAGVWPLVADDAFCRCCTFRSLCGRGEYAGNFEEFSLDYDNMPGDDLFLGFDEVDEVGF